MDTTRNFSSETANAADMVNGFLRLIMLPDPVAASRFTASGMKILFTGGRAMSVPADCTKFNASRYKWVKKRIERTETVSAGANGAASSDWCSVWTRSIFPVHSATITLPVAASPEA